NHPTTIIPYSAECVGSAFSSPFTCVFSWLVYSRKIGGSSFDTWLIGEYSVIHFISDSRRARNSPKAPSRLPMTVTPKAWPPYLAFGIQSRQTFGSSVVWAPFTAAQ